MSEKFKYEFTCVNGHETRLELSKVEAAFEDMSEYPCPICNSTDKDTASGGLPNLDHELITIWLNDDSLSFPNVTQEDFLSMHPAAIFIEYMEIANQYRFDQLLQAVKQKISGNDFFTPTGRRDLQKFLSDKFDKFSLADDPQITEFIKSGVH